MAKKIKTAADVKAALSPANSGPRLVDPNDLLSSGSTLLNLACTGRVQGAFPKGKYVLLVGDSESGKTFLSMTCLAEMKLNPNFAGYVPTHIDPEDGASMDKAYFFGEALENSLQVLEVETAEEFYDVMDDLVKDHQFVAVLDSENALSSKGDLKDIAKQRKNADAGSYSATKPKVHSQRLRILRNRLRKSKSILIVISQTRDAIGFGSQFQPDGTRSGGRALKFFADLEIWTSVKMKLTRTVKTRKREVGVTVKVKVKKNRITGKKRQVYVDFYHDTGIDDVGSNVKFLVREGHWKSSVKITETKEPDLSKGKITAPEFGATLPFEKLVAMIQDKNKEGKLQRIVGRVWNEIEAGMKVIRKNRYRQE